VDQVIDLRLHDAQFEVFNDPRRFTLCVAGRRFGKSHLAANKAFTEVLKTERNGYDLSNVGVFYIAPTFDQAKRIVWGLLKRLAMPFNPRILENTGRMEFPNGRWLEVRGADKPDTLRGVGLSYVVIDEFADMKPNVWEEIIRPALTDVEGGAMFIGTPKGKNHFWQLWEEGLDNPDEYGCHQFVSRDNPFLKPEEIDAARRNMTAEQFRQEYEARFSGAGTGALKEEWLKYAPEPIGGAYTMAVDLAGFVDEFEGQGKYKRLDDTAIAIVKIHDGGWHVKEIRYGHWGVRECAVQILKAAHDYGIQRLGVEKGALFNAVMPYLSDRMRAISYFPEVTGLYHGGKKKTDRIMWALGGRFEHGRVTLEQGGRWLPKFIDEYLDFPNKLAKDDLIDALAYVNEMAVDGIADYANLGDMIEEWEPIDEDAGI